MILIRPEDILHKFQLLKLLSGIADEPRLSAGLYFKGGTCAAMLGFLDRFSVDLDFDLKPGQSKPKLINEFKKVFKQLDFAIKAGNEKIPLFILKYPAPAGQRNTLKASVNDQVLPANIYRPMFLPEIDRLVNCQTIETMFSHKLAAPLDRFTKHRQIAGRDIYDIHYFFSQGSGFNQKILEQRTGLPAAVFLTKLISFIDKKVTETVISEDLNPLLPPEKFQKIRRTLKSETLLYLKAYISHG
ncbi:hypothetical protein COW80_01010 [Candidatus Beckwithbacteria bacterium CG22_combo_CG10-13_8_21_14_all_01_47_9]|uniref:Nucleotidyl transferase AbiEii/AbiGii toxin family protein n=4 Tax=Candidatus Beckwithiibacteriota TaxID=1752726 RepID=A0A2H0E1J8_9BACT|nr:MAG: hypothetical protein COX09_03550 [Candidatus Beckwithbacteria bacterium CG23_combo_of_CG06-09_8_20_14_all_47_9]PIP88312.1 MAG: hypothetical protein COW80_01010 [Candidatus Beckwithbacteria bacterium CG22_combo_CG10-13_8_21_14_all_01_47_9]PJA22231.1 MAG: hypothetical protein COX59_03180 [Candidatus Beckwithbacteria bacterium CG_4_10_14_0_2_um_filter_47_25]PJC66007.1 MAG: hypothetical protein CO018_04170 [Candidatus Beckwithbacteria bacterium CG_4_9_14_0_2_um_filter_47_11]